MRLLFFLILFLIQHHANAFKLKTLVNRYRKAFDIEDINKQQKLFAKLNKALREHVANGLARLYSYVETNSIDNESYSYNGDYNSYSLSTRSKIEKLEDFLEHHDDYFPEEINIVLEILLDINEN
jgi:hypothetical protein